MNAHLFSQHGIASKDSNSEKGTTMLALVRQVMRGAKGAAETPATSDAPPINPAGRSRLPYLPEDVLK